MKSIFWAMTGGFEVVRSMGRSRLATLRAMILVVSPSRASSIRGGFAAVAISVVCSTCCFGQNVTWGTRLAHAANSTSYIFGGGFTANQTATSPFVVSSTLSGHATPQPGDPPCLTTANGASGTLNVTSGITAPNRFHANFEFSGSANGTCSVATYQTAATTSFDDQFNFTVDAPCRYVLSVDTTTSGSVTLNGGLSFASIGVVFTPGQQVRCGTLSPGVPYQIQIAQIQSQVLSGMPGSRSGGANVDVTLSIEPLNNPPLAQVVGSYCSSPAEVFLQVFNLPPYPTAFQWQWLPTGSTIWANLNDGPVTNPHSGEMFTLAGTQTQSLDCTAGNSESALYRCNVTNACGTLTSTQIPLAFQAPSQGTYPPFITGQPSATVTCPAGVAMFTLAASGTTPTYQWQVESPPDGGAWVNIANGTNIVPGVPPFNAAGALTFTLSVTETNAAGDSSASSTVRCIVTNACGSVPSDPAQLFVDPSDVGQQGGLPGRDGLHDNNDFVVFIDLFFNQQPAADLGKQGGLLGSDGQFDNNDFVVFIDQFFTAC